MEFSVENVQALVRMAYVTHARDAFGLDGEQALTSLLDSVRLIFQRCPPEHLSKPLTVVRGGVTKLTPPIIGLFGQIKSASTAKQVGEFLADLDKSSYALVESIPDGTFRYLELPHDVDLKVLANDGIVYRFEDGTERILAKGYDDFVLKVSSLLKSNFAVPTLHSLEEALRHYEDVALETKCKILAGIWVGGVDGPRLVLVNKPESIMRDSLVNHLQLVLRDTSVQPEHNTDETKPVDIKVDWFGSGASALIEVKWLGKSVAVPRNKAAGPTYTEYGAPRAQAGADQLADYMDREVRHSDATAPRGYLVVFDARRKNTSAPDTPLAAEDAMYFSKDVLTLNPDYSQSRKDFAPPVRFFLNPRKSFFATKRAASGART